MVGKNNFPYFYKNLFSALKMDKNNTFKNLEDAVEYLYSEEILVESDILALSPKEGEPTDEEILNNEETGIPAVTDVAGYVEIQPKDLEDDSEDNLPSTSFVPIKKIPNINKLQNN